MATGDEPPIFDAAEQGWRDALAAFPKMPVVLGIGVLAMFALRVLPLGPGSITNPTPDQLFWFQVHSYVFGNAIFVAQSFLLTPVAIAVHRFVLLGEVTRRYTLGPMPRFRRFFLFSMIFQLLLTLPVYAISIFRAVSGFDNAIALTIILYFLYIASVIAALRMLILFPAIAVDAPGAGWRNAGTDTGGHTWRLLLILVVTAVPIIGLLSALPEFESYASLHLDSWVTKIRCFMLNETFCWGVPIFVTKLNLAITNWTFSFAYAVVDAFALCAFAAVASRLCTAFAKKLNG